MSATEPVQTTEACIPKGTLFIKALVNIRDKRLYLKFTAGKKVPSVLITDKYTSIFLVSQLRWVKEVNGKHSYSNKTRIFKDHS